MPTPISSCLRTFCLAFVLGGTIWPQSAPPIPVSLQRPAGQTLLLHAIGKGNQVYVCQNSGTAYSWKLEAPDAALFDENNHAIGRHFTGPTWQSDDSSRVTGKLAASVPSPDPNSIPWLLVTAQSHSGSGIMTRVETIQRLHTIGGIAPSASCGASNAHAEIPVSYQADYYFYGSPQH